MKRWLLLCFISGVSAVNVYAQNAVREFMFNGDFTEQNGHGPDLVQICTGAFASESLPDYNITRTVYQFDKNCGFYFDDSIENFISSGNYTIELYFTMTALDSWKRVIEFKSRTSDRGCYVFNGQLNFYNIATSSSTAPFQAATYSQYVITRNDADKHVMMYGDGDKFIQFTDNNDDAVYDASKKLRFFQDDLAIGGEASAGSIALLRIYNYAMDSVTVKETYDVLSNSLAVSKTAAVPEFSIHPNPVRDVAVLELPGPDTYRYAVSDISGRIMLQGEVSAGNNRIDLQMLPEGMYMIHVQDRQGSASVRKLLHY